MERYGLHGKCGTTVGPYSAYFVCHSAAVTTGYIYCLHTIEKSIALHGQDSWEALRRARAEY